MRVGGAVGTAVFAGLLQHRLGGAASVDAAAHAYGATFRRNLGATALVAVAALGLPRGAAAPPGALARQGDALDLEQGHLAVQAAGVAGEAPGGSDHAVAGHDDRDRVGAQGAARGA
jgi:hypothetical protein